MKKIFGLAMVMAGSIASGPAMAQNVTLPPFLQEIGELQYQGNVSGMDLYTMGDFSALWLVAPDGKTAVAGSIFSSTGRDIGAAFSGAEPVTAFLMDETVEPAPVAMENPTSNHIQDDDASGILTEDELAKMEKGLAVIEGEIFGTQEHAVSASGETSAHVSPDGGDLPITAQLSPEEAEDLLASFDEDEKEVLTRALAELLRDVSTEAEFRQAIDLWTAELARRIGERSVEDSVSSSASVENDDPEENIVISADQTPERNVLPPVEIKPGSAADVVVPAKANMSEEALAEKFLTELRHERFWFGVGNPNAPAVYAFVDPTCPYCARAMSKLKEEVDQGRLQLRVLLVPAVSAESPKYIAGILSAEKPPEAYWTHEINKARRGRSDLELADWESLPETFRNAIAGNVNMMREYGVTGVPFFAFDTDEGAKVVSGVPEVADFEDAIVDYFNGSH